MGNELTIDRVRKSTSHPTIDAGSQRGMPDNDPYCNFSAVHCQPRTTDFLSLNTIHAGLRRKGAIAPNFRNWGRRTENLLALAECKGDSKDASNVAERMLSLQLSSCGDRGHVWLWSKDQRAARTRIPPWPHIPPWPRGTG